MNSSFKLMGFLSWIPELKFRDKKQIIILLKKNSSEADQNFLYCEFMTGASVEAFKEYYDLDDDPSQLYNRYTQLTLHAQQKLHADLEKLKVCRGKECNGKFPDGYRRMENRRSRFSRKSWQNRWTGRKSGKPRLETAKGWPI